MIKPLVVLLLVSLVGCSAEAPEAGAPPSTPAASPLEGAWVSAEVTTSGPDSASLNIRAPQPGYLLFTDGHYSLVRVNTAEPRAALLQPDRATVEDLLAVYGGAFTAQAGRYEMTERTLTLSPLVAKNPAVMAPGNQNRYEVRLLADSLWMSIIRADTTAAPPNPMTLKYTRVR